MMHIFIILFMPLQFLAKAIITNSPTHQVGDNSACFALAKILSLQHNIPFYYSEFKYSSLFMLDILEKRITPSLSLNLPRIYVRNEKDIVNHKDSEVILYTDIYTEINTISPSDMQAVKKDFELKEKRSFDFPDKLTIGIHIRKGNGGGEYYDGEQASVQNFNTQHIPVNYIHYENFPFDWDSYERKNGLFIKDHEIEWLSNDPIYYVNGKVAIDCIKYWQTKFPPNQFYVDQIINVSNILQDMPLAVIICTDDKDPAALVENIKRSVNKANIEYHFYQNNQPYNDAIQRDLSLLSQCDILIRSQSYFARLAELMGNHKMVIYPLTYKWDVHKLIMQNLVIKCSIDHQYFLDLWDIFK